ncbi:PAS domain-containing protein [Aurantibacter sp.]|uniref:PAS domain-containing protein n=1 Tax=Aurantibacter sp. TaxID=2807103 RepID=UPI00326488E2
MELKTTANNSNKTIPFKIALVIAIFLLFFIASVNYREIKHLQTSSELVSTSLIVDKEINNLFSQFSLMESAEFRSVILKDSTFADSYIDYKIESDKAFDKLSELTKDYPEQQAILDTVALLKDKLHNTLIALHGKIGATDSDVEVIQNVDETAELLKKIRSQKVEMVLNKEALLQERLAVYEKQTFLTPLTSLLLVFFALVVFTIAFIKIRRDKDHIQTSQALLQNIVQSTDNIMNYYEPIYNNQNEVSDFKIIFANDCNREYLGLDPEEIIGKPISSVFPFLLLNGELEKMISHYKKGETVDFERQVAVNGEILWLHSIIKPMDKGILVVIRNDTDENMAHEKVLALNEQLVLQNSIMIEAKRMARIGSYTWHIETDKAEISDNFYHILGYKPQEFEPSFENYRKLIHPDDVVTYEEIMKGVMESREAPDHTYRVLAKNGDTIYLKTKGKFLRNKGKEIMISVVQDITTEMMAMNELQKLNEQLEVQNSIFVDAEGVAGLGSYIWYLDNGEAILSDNFYRILGLEPKSLEISYDSYKQFVHPDDLEDYNKLGEETVNQGESSISKYRIISANGKVKHLVLNGQYIEKNGRPTSVGVVQNVSKKVRADEKLRVKNLELERSNVELDSFNRVASHDLQEPLRKIQMFLSRIADKEGDKLSEKGLEYFDKVNNAAQRMQSLIRNLLTYSRIDSTHGDFEKVDLNEVLEKVQDDIGERITDSNAVIVSEQLPKVKGIFFQLEQLFSNLISNALKYHDPLLAPKINLKSEKVHKEQIPEDFFKTYKHYYKITIVDNGIGFSEENAGKIFEVFQRLHQKNEYSGTGIGLAICKKIVENHHGNIHATSKLGKGSAFVIYLPA